MHKRPGEYILLRASDFLRYFECGIIPVAGGNWCFHDCTVIFLQDLGGNHSQENALWFEAHLPWCTDVTDVHPIYTEHGVTIGGPPCRQVSATQNVSFAKMSMRYIRGSIELKQDEDRGSGQIWKIWQ